VIRSKKPKCIKSKEPEIILDCLNKTFIIEKSADRIELIKSTPMYNITPLSTKMDIKNVLKGNSKAQVPVRKFKRKLDVKKLQDDSSFFFNKVPALIPLVTTRRPITFDDLDTDDERPKGRYPKWSFPRYYMRKMKEQIWVDRNLIGALFSSPWLNTAGVLSMFPSTCPENLLRNESSIWETLIMYD